MILIVFLFEWTGPALQDWNGEDDSRKVKGRFTGTTKNIHTFIFLKLFYRYWMWSDWIEYYALSVYKDKHKTIPLQWQSNIAFLLNFM